MLSISSKTLRLPALFVVLGLVTITGPAMAQNANRLAQMEATLALIQEELKRVTGRLEATEFERNQLARRVQALEAQVRSLTSGGAQGAASPAIANPPSQTDASAANQPSSEPPAASNSNGQIIGTLNREALLGVDSGRDIATNQSQPASSPGELYNRGIGHLERGDWNQAVTDFRTFGERYPDHELATNAGFWLGESLFYGGNYAAAAAQFSRNYQSVGENGPRAEENLLKIGLSLVELGDFARACQTFDQLEARYTTLASPIRQAMIRGRAASSC